MERNEISMKSTELDSGALSRRTLMKLTGMDSDSTRETLTKLIELDSDRLSRGPPKGQ